METRLKRPDYAAFHASLAEELYAVKDRIRSLVSHWGTDGEHKEVALRSVLRRHLPESVLVGRGFIVARDWSSTQIDVLVVDASKPTLFKDGDLLIVTPDAVRGVVEVKTQLRTRREIAEALKKLSQVETRCFGATGRDSVWTGLFIFEGEHDQMPGLLEGLANAHAATRRPIDCISCGKNAFVRFLQQGKDVRNGEVRPGWHGYALPGMAPSYFMGNLIDSIGCVDDGTAGFAWFPMVGGKEQHRTHSRPLAI